MKHIEEFLMSKNNSRFCFKHFSVSHHRSSMKVGVDGVLIGAWADVEGAKTILDVGTGCGLITLMMAQRNEEANVIGIDIDNASVEEAKENVDNSPWYDRISIIHGDFPNGLVTKSAQGFDLIISNPPFFDSGVSQTHTSRERARHQGSLSPSSLLEASVSLLNDLGCLAMIVPTELTQDIEEKADRLGYSLIKKCFVRGHKDAPYKRTLLQWRIGVNDLSNRDIGIEYMTLENDRGVPTDEYRQLCKDFYMKF